MEDILRVEQRQSLGAEDPIDLREGRSRREDCATGAARAGWESWVPGADTGWGVVDAEGFGVRECEAADSSPEFWW